MKRVGSDSATKAAFRRGQPRESNDARTSMAADTGSAAPPGARKVRLTQAQNVKALLPNAENHQ